ncbi:helix-turn-helix domain-containing protein [Novosphingobium mathurense]|uniref:Helix-turn-helix domain-containing protein n=1 Tax=Novosphingobium mathurense TaxID=428990 RepID=A0A1U6ITA3_9SPHN|nr:helix-turn-helix transcriptional regulator [Novosphingobium mathurense]SLK11257.1 Helix-turn-helix domain-containing protein [Novosphingobium mathurense]
MPKREKSPAKWTLSRYGREAVTLLGQLIRTNRLERQWSVQELADRVGVSRDMIQRIEHGDPRCTIGIVFEAASVVGVPLFEEDRGRLAYRVAEQANKLRLMPKSVRQKKTVVKDDF